MPQIDKIYKNVFRKHFNHEANYPLDMNVVPGDFGTYDNDELIIHGNIREKFNIDFKVKIDPTPSYERFQSEGSVNVNFGAKGDIGPSGIPLVKAQLGVQFGSEKACFFSATEVRYNYIDDITEVGKKIVDLYKHGQWKKEWFLVSRIIDAGYTIVLISGKSGANVSLEANSDILEKINLANVGLGLSVKVSNGVAYQFISAGCQLGYGLTHVRKPLFKPVESKEMAIAEMEEIETTDENLAFIDFQKLYESDAKKMETVA